MAKKFKAKSADFNGMTVNERLALSGMLEKFDAAARSRQRAAMIAILKRVELSDDYAAQWVDTLLGDTTFFYRW